MKFAVLLEEEHNKVDWAVKENNEIIIIEAEKEKDVYSLLSDPHYTYAVGFQEKDVFKKYYVRPVMEYGNNEEQKPNKDIIAPELERVQESYVPFSERRKNK